MKKGGLSIFVIFCMAGTFLTVMACHCVDGDCQGVPQKIQSGTPQCHSTTSSTTGKDSPRKECCGKCRIEKAAVLFSDRSIAGEIRHKNTSIETTLVTDPHSKIWHRPFSYEAFSESPPGFFIQHVFAVSISFRAPPQG